MDILSTLLVLIGLGLASIVVFLASRIILRQLFGPAAETASSRFVWVNDPADANRQARARTLQPASGTKRQAMYRHLHQVGPELRRRYGAQRHYRPAQVREVMTSSRSNRYPDDNDCYSYATYCTREDFDEYHRSIDESCDYGAMRQEICQSFDFLPGGLSLMRWMCLMSASDSINLKWQAGVARQVMARQGRDLMGWRMPISIFPKAA